MNVYEILEKTTKYGYQELTIFYDIDPLNPRKEFDNLGFMVCLHKRYNLGDKHNFKNAEEIHKYIKENKIKTVLPLYLYDHSGLTINTTGFYCSWDSGQIGYIWIEDNKIRDEFNVKRISKKLRNKIREYLKNEVNTYDQYLTNDCYGYELKEYIRINPNGDYKEKFIDSCWGFYGSNFQENGLYEYANWKE